MRSFATRLAHCLLAVLLTYVVTCLCPLRAAADPGPAELAAGVAARGAHPPDLPTARAHFEQAARDEDDRSAAEALYFLAEMDDADLQFRSAQAHYDASAARLASSRYTPRAKTRGNELRSHSEGDFAPFVRLETIRRSAALANDPAAIDALVHDAASFPPGKVRVEARMLGAEAYLGRLGRTGDALPLLRLVASDPKAEVLTARAAASELVHTYVAENNLSAALDVTRTYPKLLEPTAERTILRLIRRGPLRAMAWGDLLTLAAFALLALVRPGRARVVIGVRRVVPMALLFAALASGVGGYLASRYEQTSPYPFAAMFPVTFVIIALARGWSAAGSPARPARALRAVVAFVAVFGAAFLLLDRMDPIYLQGFGL